MLWVVAAVLMLASALGPPPAAIAGDAVRCRHAYYLFLAEPAKGCDDCYVPLLIADERIERAVARGEAFVTVLVTTYERDSIWEIERGIPVRGNEVRVPERILRIRGRTYRYQKVEPVEVLRLLEKPEGTIPIHRLKAPPNREAVADLVSAFQMAECP
jgi:hypothetical protein